MRAWGWPPITIPRDCPPLLSLRCVLAAAVKPWQSSCSPSSMCRLIKDVLCLLGYSNSILKKTPQPLCVTLLLSLPTRFCPGQRAAGSADLQHRSARCPGATLALVALLGYRSAAPLWLLRCAASGGDFRSAGGVQALPPGGWTGKRHPTRCLCL